MKRWGILATLVLVVTAATLGLGAGQSRGQPPAPAQVPTPAAYASPPPGAPVVSNAAPLMATAPTFPSWAPAPTAQAPWNAPTTTPAQAPWNAPTTTTAPAPWNAPTTTTAQAPWNAPTTPPAPAPWNAPTTAPSPWNTSVPSSSPWQTPPAPSTSPWGDRALAPSPGPAMSGAPGMPGGPRRPGGPENERVGLAGGAIPPAPSANADGRVRELLRAWGRPPAPAVDPRRFNEAHWQGIEVIPNTPGLAAALGLPPNAAGVIIDDVTLPADLQGFQAGDLITHVRGTPTPDLVAFIEASEAVRDQPMVPVALLRDGQPQSRLLWALRGRLGNANGETPPMIPPGARMPHPFRGPCVNCHRIGTTGNLPADQGNMTNMTVPVIRVGAVRPHRDFGPCETCHQIVP